MYIHVRATAGHKQESLEQLSETHFSVTVREEAERNQANRRIVELVAEHFGLAKGKVRIVNGHHSPSKLLSVSLEEPKLDG